ncbi:MAG TPA: ABC transporter permease [Capsulimonadaceae bacterium]|nr:ABC transporter permease [Capsulimonadaceae bacterium]
MAATTAQFGKRFAPLAQLLWANPVVIRDLRVFLRGAKAYWALAGYLFTLGVIVLVGYGSAVSGNAHGGMVNVVDIQAALQAFYYFVFVTIATLLSLIAPALTAASVTSERQRLTLDLLVTTPLSAAQLLTGKILSSVAFLLLLLALSLPASALCIILGGATLGDVLRIYLLLGIDSLVLSAIGIAFSSNARASIAAIGWTYVAVIAFEIMSAIVFTSVGALGRMAMIGGGSIKDLNPGVALAALNPYVAVFVGSGSIDVFGVGVPVWLATAVAAILVIRLLLTGAACRLRLYGSGAYASLRRQLLLLTVLIMVPLAYGISSGVIAAASSPVDQLELAIYLLTFAFLIPGALFLPSLFVPAHGEDLPPLAQTGGWYRPLRMFRPEHAGALPFFHLWLITLLASAAAGMAFAGHLNRGLAGDILLTGFYLSGLGFFYWALCRFTGAVARNFGPAQAMAFGLLVLASAVPPMLSGVSSGDLANSPFAPIWIFNPLDQISKGSKSDAVSDVQLATFGAGVLCYIYGLVVNLIARAIERAKARKETKALA